MSGPHDDLAARLDEIVADLDERSFDILREAAASKVARPVEDKRLTQARRAIEKASHLLRGIGEAGGTAGDTFDAFDD